MERFILIVCSLADVLEIEVAPGPLGVLLNRTNGLGAVVEGFVRLPDGTMGNIQRCKKIHVGAMLMTVNGSPVDKLTLPQITFILQKTAHLERTIGFRLPNDKPAIAQGA